MNNSIQYLFSDMDGTLLNSRKEVSQDTIHSIQRFICAGGHFGVATGRSPEITLPLLTGVPINTPCILFNGAGIYDFSTKKYLHQEFLPQNIVRDICRTAEESYPQVCVEAFAEGPILLLNKNCVMDHFITEENQPCRFSKFSLDMRYMKLLLYAEPQKLRLICQKLIPIMEGKVSYTFSAPFYLEILPLGISKGTALEWLCKAAHISRTQVAAIGDFDNDAEMLRYSALGAAPANASPAAKAAADYQVPSNDEHCVSHLLENYILA